MLDVGLIEIDVGFDDGLVIAGIYGLLETLLVHDRLSNYMMEDSESLRMIFAIAQIGRLAH